MGHDLATGRLAGDGALDPVGPGVRAYVAAKFIGRPGGAAMALPALGRRAGHGQAIGAGT